MAKKKKVAVPKKSAAAKPAKKLAGVFAALKDILEPYEKDLHVLPYKPEYYCLVTRLALRKGKPVWFAAIRMGKNYVSYHFMPVYMNPAMQKRIPPQIKKRMQVCISRVAACVCGVSCTLSGSGTTGRRP